LKETIQMQERQEKISRAVLVHPCCGPCMTGVFPELSKEKKIYGFFYNPNIHPLNEFSARLMTAGFVASQFGFKLFVDADYGIARWLEVVKDFEKRCFGCVYMRLKRTAEFAEEKKIKSFTTTLLVSPYHDHEYIKETGCAIAKKTGVEFFYRDFRKNYQDSIKKSKEMLLYRQKYCGCVFSQENDKVKH